MSNPIRICGCCICDGETQNFIRRTWTWLTWGIWPKCPKKCKHLVPIHCGKSDYPEQCHCALYECTVAYFAGWSKEHIHLPTKTKRCRRAGWQSGGMGMGSGARKRRRRNE